MLKIRRFVTAAVAMMLCAPTLFAQEKAATIEPLAGEWRELFNGKDLGDWTVVMRGEEVGQDANKIFQVKDGLIHVYPDQADGGPGEFGFIVTNDEFSNYDLTLEYQWLEKRFGRRAKAKRDSGILVHTFQPMEKLAVWPPSVECQIQEGDTGDIWSVKTKATAKAATADGETSRTYSPNGTPVEFGGQEPNGRQVRDSRMKHNNMLEKDGWNTVEMRVRGDRGVHIVNGVQNNEWSNLKMLNEAGEWVKLEKGKILLQAEGAELQFRNIKIRESR